MDMDNSMMIAGGGRCKRAKWNGKIQQNNKKGF